MRIIFKIIINWAPMVIGVFIENPVGFHVQYSTVKPVIVVKELTILE